MFKFIIKKFKSIKNKGLKKSYRRICYLYHNRMRKCKFGDKNPDKVFYVIRGIDHHSKYYDGVALNLLANYSYVLSHLIYAEKKGWIPLIDQRNDPVNVQEDFMINGTNNPWEYFWKQPTSYSLEDVYRSSNVILSKREWYAPGNLEYDIHLHTDLCTVNRYHKLMDTIQLNHATQKYVDGNIAKLLNGRGKILGISLRRGGHSKADSFHASKHPIQPTPEQLAKLVQNRLIKWNMDAVFLATEEQQYIEYFKDIFGEKLIYLDRKRYNNWRVYTENENPLYQKGSRYQTALDYLTEMELLASCQGLIGSITSGLRYAIFKNNLVYEHIELLDNGYFP